MKKTYLGIVAVLALASLSSCAVSGAKGEKGDTGAPGLNGSDGKDGLDGSSLLNGKGVPENDLGKNGDSYIDLDTFDYYVKENGAWKWAGNIKGKDGSNGEAGSEGKQGEQGIQGEKGDAGAEGSDGSSVRTGEGVPASSLGSDGDSYIDLDTFDYYVKENGAWKWAGNIKGKDGDDGKGIVSVELVSKENGKATYRITFTSGEPVTFEVEDGETPEITIDSDGYWCVDGKSTEVKAQGKEGRGVEGIDASEPDANGVVTYTVRYTDGETDTFTVTNGKDGEDGASLLSGSGAPKKEQGKDGDSYVDTATFDYYVKENGEWARKGNMKGTPGEAGQPGQDGTSVLTGKGKPSEEDGVSGDVYIDLDSWDVYVKGESWNVSGNIKGAQGATIESATIDEDGDLIVKMSDGKEINAGHVKDVASTHKVRFHCGPTTKTVSVEHGSKTSAPDVSLFPGFERIDSWKCNLDGGYRWLFSAYTVTSDLDLYAVNAVGKSYTISFSDPKFGTSVTSKSVNYWSKIDLPTIEDKTGWTFAGWETSEDEVIDVDECEEYRYQLTSDLALTAIWVADTYAVTLDPNGGSLSSTSIQVTYDSSYEIPTPTKDHYIFKGWYDSSDARFSSTGTWKRTEDLALTAKWECEKYTFNLDAGEGTCEASTIQIGWEESYTLPTPIRLSEALAYEFEGWYLNDQLIPQSGSSWTYSASGGTLVAKWGEEANYAQYGIYPQTYVSDSSLIERLNAVESAEANGWYKLDGEYYATLTTDYNLGDDYLFDDGSKIESRTKYWFKCEPIKWNILSSSNGTYSLVAARLLDKRSFEPEDSSNYANSSIRTWLNGTFYNNAFALENSLIQEVAVDNSAATTKSADNAYASDETKDKVYLLSYQDYKNSSYFPDNASRQCRTTDWCRTKCADEDDDCEFNGVYWTRSPSGESHAVSVVNRTGGIGGTQSAEDSDNIFVRPAITIKIS